jgi:hypothetical protein
MTIRDILLSPPVAGALFLGLILGIYRLSGRLAAGGKPYAGKHQAYACGEDLLPPEAQLSYHTFFQLALMFSLLHLATLVVSTLGSGGGSRRLAIIYLLGLAISTLVLTGHGEKEA